MMGLAYLIYLIGPASPLFKGKTFLGVKPDYIIIKLDDLTKVRGSGKFNY